MAALVAVYSESKHIPGEVRSLCWLSSSGGSVLIYLTKSRLIRRGVMKIFCSSILRVTPTVSNRPNPSDVSRPDLSAMAHRVARTITALEPPRRTIT
ncbi:hypothetical protein QR680_015736 [Steinernema hermaphroditum]|uniref:Uncharacterized protein n=1 Tax=Steinernema hermaphroditum TaxID=289476 RepID=A0AA39H8T2_9BILA|nr:hypothetical protein QR680_015736 [Steinernema hermaphroditum]